MKLPNGFGSVYRLTGKRRNGWGARKTVGWKINPKTEKKVQLYKNIGYYETQEESLTALVNYNANPYDMDAGKITFKEVYEKWTNEHFKKISKSNVQGYTAAYLLCDSLNDIKFADIKRNHLQSVVDKSGKNYPTLRKLKVLFNQLYKFAIQNDVCGKDYSEFVDIVQYKDRNPNKFDRKPFTNEDIEKVWKWADKNEYIPIILMLLYSGVRVSELLDLKKENVHLEDRYFDVIASKTESGIRKVPIAQKTIPFFKYWMEKNNCKYLLSTNEGNHFEYRNYYDSYWKPFITQIGLSSDYTPHCTRHTTITLLTIAGVSDKIIKKIVGHKGQSVTEVVYTHFEIQQLIEGIDKI